MISSRARLLYSIISEAGDASRSSRSLPDVRCTELSVSSRNAIVFEVGVSCPKYETNVGGSSREDADELEACVTGILTVVVGELVLSLRLDPVEVLVVLALDIVEGCPIGWSGDD